MADAGTKPNGSNIADSYSKDDHLWEDTAFRFSSSARSPSYHEDTSTGLKNVGVGEDDAAEEEEDSERVEVQRGSGAVDCIRCYRNFSAKLKGAQRHRKCPHSFRICLVYFMFILLGIVERGCFVVLFYLLNTKFLLTPGETVAFYFATKFFIYLFYPVTGFLADTFYGHHRVIRVCLCIAWIGSAFMAISFAFYEFLRDDVCNALEHCSPTTTRVFTGVGYAILGIGLTGIRVNLIPFGADQLPDASAGELSSYFHWYYFCVSLGHFAALMFLPFMFRFASFAYVFLVITTAITLFLSTFVLFCNQWVILPKKGNPLRLVYNVLKSATSSRRRPVVVSAFDVGLPRPSRIDKALLKYGGSYTLEQVEEVKTFFRILKIVMTCIGYYAVFAQLQSTATMQSSRMTSISFWLTNCTHSQLRHLNRHTVEGVTYDCEQPLTLPAVFFGGVNLLPLILFIPFYDRLIYPYLNGWKWFSMLSRMAVGNFFIVASILSAIVIEGIRMETLAVSLRRNQTVLINAISFHEGITSYELASPISEFYLAIPFFFFVFAELFSNVTAVEFIYAQSPSNMKGMLIGMLFASEGLALGLNALATVLISKLVPPYHFCSFFGNTLKFYLAALDPASTCRKALRESMFGCVDGILFAYLILAVIAIISAVLFGIAAVTYKRRRRDKDPYMPIWLFAEGKETTLQYLIRKCCC